MEAIIKLSGREPQNRCFVLVNTARAEKLHNGTVYSSTEDGVWFWYSYEKQRYDVFHRYPNEFERTIWNRPFYKVTLGHTTDECWLNGKSTANGTMVSNAFKHRVFTEAVKAVGVNGIVVNWVLVAALVGCAIVAYFIYEQYQTDVPIVPPQQNNGQMIP